MYQVKQVRPDGTIKLSKPMRLELAEAWAVQGKLWHPEFVFTVQEI